MNPNQLAAMMAALRGPQDAQMPMDAPDGDVPAISEPVIEAPAIQLAHHKRLMVKAPTLAARRVHRKLFMHHQKKMG
jgi:hypothetical protein